MKHIDETSTYSQLRSRLFKHSGVNYQRLAQRNLTALERSPYGFSERLKYALLDQLKQRSRLITLTFLPEAILPKDQTKRLPGEAYIQQQHTQQLIAQIESFESDFETTQQSIQQLREYDLPAYKRWLREYDEGAYRDEFRPKRSRPNQTKPNQRKAKSL